MAPDQMSVLFVFLNRLGELLSDATQELEAAQELGAPYHTRKAKITRK